MIFKVYFLGFVLKKAFSSGILGFIRLKTKIRALEGLRSGKI